MSRRPHRWLEQRSVDDSHRRVEGLFSRTEPNIYLMRWTKNTKYASWIMNIEGIQSSAPIHSNIHPYPSIQHPNPQSVQARTRSFGKKATDSILASGLPTAESGFSLSDPGGETARKWCTSGRRWRYSQGWTEMKMEQVDTNDKPLNPRARRRIAMGKETKYLPLTDMDVEIPVFVEQNGLPRGHAILHSGSGSNMATPLETKRNP